MSQITLPYPTNVFTVFFTYSNKKFVLSPIILYSMYIIELYSFVHKTNVRSTLQYEYCILCYKHNNNYLTDISKEIISLHFKKINNLLFYL